MNNAIEFRLGNLFLVDGKVFAVEGVDKYSQRVISKNGSEYFIVNGTVPGIPLTHEWLERCGFTIPDEHGYMMRVNKGVVRIKIDDRLKFPSVKIGDLHCAVTPFVHQLQNLYFALTGEELTINHEHLQTTS